MQKTKCLCYSRWRDSMRYLVDLPRSRGGGVLVCRVAPKRQQLVYVTQSPILYIEICEKYSFMFEISRFKIGAAHRYC